MKYRWWWSIHKLLVIAIEDLVRRDIGGSIRQVKHWSIVRLEVPGQKDNAIKQSKPGGCQDDR